MGRGQELLDAAREGDRKTVEKILGQITKRSGPFTSLRRGAGVNVQDDNGYTPLHHACLHGRKEIVRLLLAADASPCVVDKKAATPLHLAAFKGDSDVVAMLLAHNNPPVNIDQLTSDHETALLIAAHFGYVDVVAQLMAKGADVTIENNNGESALDLAAQYGRLETVQHLLRVRPELVDQYYLPAYKQWIFTSTPLHRASKHGRKEVVAALIKAGVDPNVRTANGTALHEAVCFGKHSVVRVLLDNGADIDARDSQGKTVYDLLADYSEEATRRVRRALKDYENRRNQRSAYESDDDLLPPFPVPGPDHSPTGYHHANITKAPEIQKNTNINKSLMSPSSSSLIKNQPQSFVKKLASKCLGLKAKFNSAPNISNNPGTELAVDVKNKGVEHKSTNTLLIGNSKFFNKILSKKEDSGEINCNDEFDTISLDRITTLNRDSVVNKSNRSCPGFKTSLPNISEHNELSDSQDSLDVHTDEFVVVHPNLQNKNHLPKLTNVNGHDSNVIFEPRDKRLSISSNNSSESANFTNECYESYEFSNSRNKKLANIPKPPPRPSAAPKIKNDDMIYENLSMDSNKNRPVPAVRTHLPTKKSEEAEKPTLYENILLLPERKIPEPPKRSNVPVLMKSNNNDVSSLRSGGISSSSSSDSDSLIDESNLEDILLSEKSKSFRRSRDLEIYACRNDAVVRTQSNASDMTDITEASAIENVDCSEVDQSLYLPMTGTLPTKNKDIAEKKHILFRHKTFTNIEIDRNSYKTPKVPEFPKWNNEFLKETLASYHIRGTGHCIYKAPTVSEFLNIFNRDTLSKPSKVPCDENIGTLETAICFCKPKLNKNHNSAEDLLDVCPIDDQEKVNIDFGALKNFEEMSRTSFRCFCDSKTCTFHSERRESGNLIVKFSAVKKSISTPNITLDTNFTVRPGGLIKNKSVPSNLEEPYAVVNLADIIARNNSVVKVDKSPVYTPMFPHGSLSSTSSSRLYSIKDIEDVISLNDNSTPTAARDSSASDTTSIHKSASEYSGHWSLQSCDSNVTIKSDATFVTCYEDSSDESDDTLHSDEEVSDAETVKSDVSTTKRPWVHSNSFNFGNKGPVFEGSVITEENSYDSSSSKIESGISVKGSESSFSDCEEGVPRVDGDVSLGASLERGSGAVGGVRSGSGRRRWDETEGTSEGDALSVSSAASSCAPLHLAHHYEHSKVSPTPPKKPPRRNLSVSPTHANSPSSGYSYELRPHARSQDDLDDIQGAKHYLKHGRSVDQYVDGKFSYAEYEDHPSPRIAPVPNPRPSLKNRTQPVAITAMYENVVIKEQNPRRKLRRNNFGPQNEGSDNKMNDNRVRKYSNQERSSLESLLDDLSMNSPSDCERYDGQHRADIPLSPTHYDQPPTPDHPPPSARQAENSIHERIRPLSQEYKRRSILRDSQTETEVSLLLRAASAASVASGATDRSGNTDNCVEEYVCDVPFAGLFKGSTTTLDGIGLRPMPAERPKTLRKLKSVYDTSPSEAPVGSFSNGQDRNLNGMEDEVRRRSNTTSSNQSGDKSLSILSPFDEQEEWAKISEIMASFGSKLVRESVFVSELEQEFTSRLGLSCSESSLSPSVASNLGHWLAGLGLHDYETLFVESGFDDIDFINGILDDNDLREMGIEENERQKILESSKQLPLKIAEISNNHNNNNISKNENESVEDWLRNINLQQYSDTFRKHLYVDMDRVKRIWEVELTAVLEIHKAGHRKRILASVSGEQNGPVNNMEDISADLNTLKNNIQQLKEEIKEKLPENLKAVPPPVVPTLAPPGGETLKRSKKNRPAPQPPRPSDLEIRAPSELLVGVPGALKTQWKHQPFVLVTGAVTYVANYLGSTVVKELRGTESTKKSIQKLKKSTKEPRDSPDIILSISYRGVKFLNTITRELVCEHEIRNIHCACQDADDLTHFAYITKDHATKSHYCHVFRVATMDQATEVILTLGEAFEVAYQMALREQSNRTRVTQSLAKTPTHDPTTTSNKEKPINHGRSHSITEIKLNGHQLKIAPIPASLSNEDFQAARSTDGSKSPRTPLLKAPIASTEEL
ncbi:ankyrin repeat and sterile alpha motif domain-containing protein 1B-like isoform X3 [Plodia interpunctella]|uniref:ankyrin repeat and sterile alpha motif domain-containing protein 1B-like isoform X3 n=1 Tax=Plodia interpunctella TaxID=58824 RepID=UPI0023683D54|nr:ankyrin repeat and sterile alpha motif domain-containing protein 1B-like isoform X3 [Plodia interpunctella]